MVHFARSGPAALSCSCARCAPRGARVTPFGCPRIAGYVLLPAAFRSLSRPSSPCSSTGIRHGPMLRLTILPLLRAPLTRAAPLPSSPGAAHSPRLGVLHFLSLPFAFQISISNHNWLTIKGKKEDKRPQTHAQFFLGRAYPAGPRRTPAALPSRSERR